MDQSLTPTPPVFTQTPVEPEPPKKSYTWLIVVLIIFLLANSSVLVYKYYQLKQQVAQTPASPIPNPSAAASPVVNPTANWKTYTGDGFSFKYPAQWDINPLPWDDSQLLDKGILVSDDQGPNEDQISLEISSTKLSDVAFPGCKQTQQILLDNVAASRCEITQEISAERGIVYNPPIISKIVYIEALHNGLYYIISLTFDQTSDKFKILDQILSTFEFID